MTTTTHEDAGNPVLHSGLGRLQVRRPQQQRPAAGTVPFAVSYDPGEPDMVTVVFGRPSRPRTRKVARELLDLGRVEPVAGAGAEVMPLLDERVEIAFSVGAFAESLSLARADVDEILTRTEDAHQDAVDAALAALLEQGGTW